ncbi:hypothetical protein KY049_001749 [Escherichia coli]|jgi:hypothetical protein|uniref:Uncharacterized protein n=1 Tax=Escherichia coli TaxID=562 RepID=A0A9Q7NXF2_ECOLX|nr:hypothetical protein [Escherichia coli]DAM16414.1 MAG TPA: Transcriptional regulator, GntR family, TRANSCRIPTIONAL REGULATOR, STRUCTURAL [Caudoviricetes sp.]EFJ99662.1 hypothetical protein HMPREF9540_00240 [Escherichia coli MS 115-1]EHU0088984.1 hypothetical protein [Escherichia coli]ELV4081833.1 hypothetical protein [Escherichia coli]RXB29791.1 hypothetical protein EPS97_13510 [Escherichia coli]
MKTELTVENRIASELNAGTDMSESKLAEKYDVPRSIVRRVKANIEEYTVVEEVKAENTVEVVDAVEAQRIVNQAFGFDNIEKLLASKSANKKPSAISMIIFKRTEGDFELFKKQMSDKTAAYQRDQFLRCVNSTKGEMSETENA